MTGELVVSEMEAVHVPGGVSLATSDGGRHLLISIGDRQFEAEIESNTRIVPPGESPHFGVSVLTGKLNAGSVLIVVNCGQEPPSLQIATRGGVGHARSWSWDITHDIQQRLLNVCRQE